MRSCSVVSGARLDGVAHCVGSLLIKPAHLTSDAYGAYLCTRDVPTPCVSFETVRRKAMGAINFTASHNPPEYNGLKFSTETGAPAMPAA